MFIFLCFNLVYVSQVNLEPQGKIHLIVDLEQGSWSNSLISEITVLISTAFQMFVPVAMKNHVSSKKGKGWTDDVEPCVAGYIKSTGTSLWPHFWGNLHFVRTAEILFGN